MGWDYNKIFAEGNIIGVKNIYKNKVFPLSVDEDNVEWLKDNYENEELSLRNQHVVDNDVPHSYSTDFNVQYVVRLDENGNIFEKIFDRDRDMVEYPELNVGTFGKTMYFDGESFEDVCRTFGEFVIAKNGYISYKNGGYDHVNDIISFKNDDVGVKLVEVYDANFFNQCNDTNLIWRNPMYEKWLKEKEEK